MPVDSRACFSRTVAIVIARFLAAVRTSALAREIRAADPQSEDYPTEEKTSGQLTIVVFHPARPRFYRAGSWTDVEKRSRREAKVAGVTMLTNFGRGLFEAAMTAIYAKARRDPSAAELIERVRKVN